MKHGICEGLAEEEWKLIEDALHKAYTLSICRDPGGPETAALMLLWLTVREDILEIEE